MKAQRSCDAGSQTLSGYDLLEVLGEGAFGTVFRARQVNTARNVIIKILRVHEASGGGDAARRIARFRLEARLCATLRHPRIVRLLDIGTTDAGCPFVVFEDEGGITLRDMLRSRGVLAAAETGRLMGQVLDALCFAHGKGVVHRDLKPANIIVCTSGAEQQAKVVEFGIGGLLWDFREMNNQSAVWAQQALGNPSYEAPEQLRGEPPVPASDLYAWGLTFLECLSGRAVMTGPSTEAIVRKQLDGGEIELPPSVAWHPLARVLTQALRKDPRERAADARVLLEELEALKLDDLDDGPHSSTVARRGVVSCDGAAGADAEELWDDVRSSEKRRVAVLCCSLSVVPVGEPASDSDKLDDVHRKQRGVCCDVVSRHGGTLVGMLADHMVFFFGYPKSTHCDARCAVLAALELVRATVASNAELPALAGGRLEIRAGIHSGVVAILCDSAPSGMTLAMASRLESKAPKETVLVSREIEELLRGHGEFEFARSELTFEPFAIEGYTVRERLAPQALSLEERGVGWGARGECEAGAFRMTPRTLLTQALLGMRGWVDGEIRASIEQSCRLLRGAQDNKQCLVATMWQVMVYHHIASNRKELRELTEELARYAATWGEPSLEVAAETFMGLMWRGEGQYDPAACALENACRLYQPVRDGVHGEVFGLDTRVWATSTLALVEWFRADSVKAYRYAEEAVEWAKAIGHAPSVCVALLAQAQLLHYARDAERAGGVVAEFCDVADEFGLPSQNGYGHILKCWVSRDAEGAEVGCSRLESRGCTAGLSYYRSLVADIQFAEGRFDEALRSIEVCLGLPRKSQAYYYTPELHRLRGECLLQRRCPDVAGATRSFQLAAEMAASGGMVRTESEALLARTRIQMSRQPEDAQARLDAVMTPRPWQHLEL